jgi:hypothetical protein
MSSSRIPPYAQAVFDALHFEEPCFDGLKGLADNDWHKVISFCHRTQLGIPFALRAGDYLPAWVADRFHQNLANNAERWRRTKCAYQEVSRAFEAARLEFITLKGFTHAPSFVADPRLRAQYDLDLFLPPDQLPAARDVALALGYQPIVSRDRHPVDHLPTLIRKTGWEWRGDYFDPELPLALELHFRLWDAATEGFAVPGLDHFWERRRRRTLEDIEFTSLAATDLPGYASAHALRHLLRGDSRPSHFYEIACFIERNSDPGFWRTWRHCHDEPLRRVEAICFAIAHHWFGCTLPAIAQQEIEQLKEPVRAWLAAYAHTLTASHFHTTKNELWLQLSLLDPGSSRWTILRRRLMPLQLPGPVDAVHLPGDAVNWQVRLRAAGRYWLFLCSRTWRHARALIPTLWNGAAWAWSRRQRI